MQAMVPGQQMANTNSSRIKHPFAMARGAYRIKAKARGIRPGRSLTAKDCCWIFVAPFLFACEGTMLPAKMRRPLAHHRTINLPVQQGCAQCPVSIHRRSGRSYSECLTWAQPRACTHSQELMVACACGPDMSCMLTLRYAGAHSLCGCLVLLAINPDPAFMLS